MNTSSANVVENINVNQARKTGIQRVEPLVEIVRENVNDIERERRLPDKLVAALHSQSMYRMLLPKSVGGSQVDMRTFTNTVEELAKLDASTAWCVCQTSGCSMAAANLTTDVATEIFGPDDAVLAWGPGKGEAHRVPGGYEVTGSWQFASGSSQATWLGCLSGLYEDGKPVLDEAGVPKKRIMLVPKANLKMKDIWFVHGLKGTSSNAYSAEKVFVPDGYSIVQDNPDERIDNSTLYFLTSRNVYAWGFAGIALGIARAMLDEFVGVARSKVQNGQKSPLAESAVVQAQVARSEANLRAARLLLYSSIDDIMEGLGEETIGSLTNEQRVNIRLASSHVIHVCSKIAQSTFHAAGSAAIFTGSTLERRLRDITTLTQQGQGRDSNFEICGKHLFGMDPNWGAV